MLIIFVNVFLAIIITGILFLFFLFYCLKVNAVCFHQNQLMNFGVSLYLQDNRQAVSHQMITRQTVKAEKFSFEELDSI